MKKGRQIEIEIRRREVSVAWPRTGAATTGAMNDGTAAERPGGLCPICGVGWLLFFDASAAVPPVTGESVQALITPLGLHLQASASGHLWVCTRSFEQAKEQSR